LNLVDIWSSPYLRNRRFPPGSGKTAFSPGGHPEYGPWPSPHSSLKGPSQPYLSSLSAILPPSPLSGFFTRISRPDPPAAVRLKSLSGIDVLHKILCSRRPMSETLIFIPSGRTAVLFPVPSSWPVRSPGFPFIRAAAIRPGGGARPFQVVCSIPGR